MMLLMVGVFLEVLAAFYTDVTGDVGRPFSFPSQSLR